MPPRTPKILLKQLVNSSRTEIRKLLKQSSSSSPYRSGEAIGKKHSLLIVTGNKINIKKQKNTIIVTVPKNVDINSHEAQQVIRQEVIKALRKEAKEYLPQRLAMLADKLDCTYKRTRLSHASTRWGSCSSSGTISLNIALMKLPFNLIDYVIIHELCHTKELNHSNEFWRLVHQADPNYKKHIAEIKQYSPAI
jgi:predicted metal-dependent hydrolase